MYSWLNSFITKGRFKGSLPRVKNLPAKLRSYPRRGLLLDPPYPTLWKMSIDGGEPIQLTKTTASRPSLSPDGKYIAYQYLDSSFERSRWGIGISSVEDGTRVKRFDFAPTVVERLVKWTPDGKGIAFLNSPNGVPNVWIQPLDGGDPKPLTDFPSDNVIAFNWNSDGSQLAVIRGVETSDVLLINRSPS